MLELALFLFLSLSIVPAIWLCHVITRLYRKIVPITSKTDRL